MTNFLRYSSLLAIFIVLAEGCKQPVAVDAPSTILVDTTATIICDSAVMPDSLVTLTVSLPTRLRSLNLQYNWKFGDGTSEMDTSANTKHRFARYGLDTIEVDVLSGRNLEKHLSRIIFTKPDSLLIVVSPNVSALIPHNNYRFEVQTVKPNEILEWTIQSSDGKVIRRRGTPILISALASPSFRITATAHDTILGRTRVSALNLPVAMISGDASVAIRNFHSVMFELHALGNYGSGVPTPVNIYSVDVPCLWSLDTLSAHTIRGQHFVDTATGYYQEWSEEYRTNLLVSNDGLLLTSADYYGKYSSGDSHNVSSFSESRVHCADLQLIRLTLDSAVYEGWCPSNSILPTVTVQDSYSHGGRISDPHTLKNLSQSDSTAFVVDVIVHR